jgi:hypothetical protein
MKKYNSVYLFYKILKHKQLDVGEQLYIKNVHEDIKILYIV